MLVGGGDVLEAFHDHGGGRAQVGEVGGAQAALAESCGRRAQKRRQCEGVALVVVEEDELAALGLGLGLAGDRHRVAVLEELVVVVLHAVLSSLRLPTYLIASLSREPRKIRTYLHCIPQIN
jgi:hypothetical protein